jgi:hypothetical protein
MPDSCLPADFVCDGLTMSTEDFELTCADAGGGCTCDMRLLLDTVETSGTWSTSGTTLLRTAEGGGAAESEYCVDGDVLSLQSPPTSGGQIITQLFGR